MSLRMNCLSSQTSCSGGGISVPSSVIDTACPLRTSPAMESLLLCSGRYNAVKWSYPLQERQDPSLLADFSLNGLSVSSTKFGCTENTSH
ncbi:MAG: hypothetical protein JWN74_1235 [Acidobacteriaceae bacterium]|nr:hypothetical protein [Acidobacteriaceae bacterium]